MEERLELLHSALIRFSQLPWQLQERASSVERSESKESRFEIVYVLVSKLTSTDLVLAGVVLLL